MRHLEQGIVTVMRSIFGQYDCSAQRLNSHFTGILFFAWFGFDPTILTYKDESSVIAWTGEFNIRASQYDDLTFQDLPDQIHVPESDNSNLRNKLKLNYDRR